jgi:CYTH domain-containing protein
MALEIERRFLVHGDDWRQAVCWQARLQQGYLVSSAEGFTVRVRTASQAGDPQAWITLKTAASADGLVRHEFEYPIPSADAEALLGLAPHQLSKWRYGLRWPGGDWVLDVFEGGNGPLVVAEVELADPEQPLEIPRCCVLELTGHACLSNAALARQPLQSWPEPQRRALLLGAADWMEA